MSWLKLYSEGTAKFRMGCVTQVNSPRLVQIDGIPHYVKYLCLWDWNHHLDMTVIWKSERLVNLGSNTLEEPDDFPDDWSSENRMTSQDDSPNTSGQNAEWLDNLFIVYLKIKLTLFLFREVLGARSVPLAIVFGIMRSVESVSERQNKLPHDPKQSWMCLACRDPIRKKSACFRNLNLCESKSCVESGM